MVMISSVRRSEVDTADSSVATELLFPNWLTVVILVTVDCRPD